MKIYRHVLDEIIQIVPCAPPETGGILGGRDRIISTFVFDKGISLSYERDIYTPDTRVLNHALQLWSQEGINFYGMFHSHFPGLEDLSRGDKRYISQLMRAMPHHISSLYFPIVIPQEKMVVYRADLYGQDVHIVGDEIEIV